MAARAACTAARTMFSRLGHDAAWKSTDKPASTAVARGITLLAADAATSSIMLPMSSKLVLVAIFIVLPKITNWASYYLLLYATCHCYCACGVLTPTRKLLSLYRLPII